MTKIYSIDDFFNPSSSLLQDKLPDSYLDQFQIGETIQATIRAEHEVYFNVESNFGVYMVSKDNDLFKCIGTFLMELAIGQFYELKGTVQLDKKTKSEKIITVNEITPVRPTNRQGIIGYLKMLKGVNYKAEILYDTFGDKVIDMIMNEPLTVAKSIRGIGEKSVLGWREELLAMEGEQQVLTTLLSYGLSNKQATELIKQFGPPIAERIQENPYILSTLLREYGFKRCDDIAKQMGFNMKHDSRIEGALLHVLEQATFEGHCYLPLEELCDRAIQLLTIRLTYYEMKRIHKENSEAFLLGAKQYPVNPLHVSSALSAYDSASTQEEKDNARYTLVHFDEDDLSIPLQNLVKERTLIYEDESVYLRSYYVAEEKVAERIISLIPETPFKRPLDGEDLLVQYCSKMDIHLEERQKEAVLRFSENKGGFFVLDGSAGCGKTFTLNIILKFIEMKYKYNGEHCEIEVFAPTGKASKIASKSTKRDCKTVHRGLQYSPAFGGFIFNEANPLDIDVLVIDETSMLDLLLAENLLSAIRRGTKVIFMGDTKQLESVGAGNVLKDIIDSNAVTVVTLNVPKRQGILSGINQNAQRIIHGEMVTTASDTKDAYILSRETAETAQQAIIQSIQRISSRFSLEDIQVLSPQRTTAIGTYYLNYLLQQAFNPSPAPIEVKKRTFQLHGQEFTLSFKVHDKVIHTRNNMGVEWYKKTKTGYEKIEGRQGITNGECGVIEEMFETEIKGVKVKRIIVRYEDAFVFYDGEFDDLDFAWALSIHKSQGSQWKAVVIPVMNLTRKMLNRNLLYTAYTRAQEFNVVVGQKDAIHHAINNISNQFRYTGLSRRLKEKIANC